MTGLTKADAGAMARYVVSQTADRAYHGTGLRRLAQTIADFGSTRRAVSELRDESTQREFLTDRVEAMIAEIAGRLRDARKLPKVDAAAAFNRNQNELIEAARAHGSGPWTDDSAHREQVADGVRSVRHCAHARP